MDATKFIPKQIHGFLVSQVGYDAGRYKQALLRSTDSSWMNNCHFEVRDVYNNSVYLTGDVVNWGEKWASTWWKIVFTDLYREGTYRILVLRGTEELAISDPFKIAENQVWNETIEPVAFEQFESRSKLARHGKGFKDCGSDWRECGSHTLALIGLCDLLLNGFEFMPVAQQKRLMDIIRTGCLFLCTLMDKAESAGYEPGSVAHEIPNHALVLPGDIASTSYVLGYASRLLFEFYPEDATDWLKRANLAFKRFLLVEPWKDGGFSRMNRGLPESYELGGKSEIYRLEDKTEMYNSEENAEINSSNCKLETNIPDGNLKRGKSKTYFLEEKMTRDIMMELWAGLQLYSSGIVSVKEQLFLLTEEILSRQISKNDAEAGFWGHFREFSNSRHSEKANTHHDVGHDTGAVIGFNILPLMEMCTRFYEHPSTPRIKAAIVQFAKNFVIPACQANPFDLLPQGVFGEEGLLDFCGPWHGTNVTYGYFASMATKLAAFVGEPYLYQIAVGNIQWICGLHAGVTKESMEGCVYWRETIPEGEAIAYSQILGVGQRCVKGWSTIKGTILNGFATNPQFTLQVPPTKSNDGPWLYTDEDWVPHAGGFTSAVAVMRNHFSVPWNA